jgi:hypothetical protein
MYGLQLEIPNNWRVEVNPKGTRAKGDVVFQSPKGNRFFVSWGPLDAATKRFKTLEEHRDAAIKRVKKGPDVKSMQVSDLNETQIGGHKALQSHVSAQVRAGGIMARGVSSRDIWSVHFYCEPTSRYYVVYTMERDSSEFGGDMSRIFSSLSKKIVCHPGAGESSSSISSLGF